MQMRINWAFAEFCDEARSVDEISDRFMAEVRALGFAYAACSSHVDPLRPPRGAVMMVNYPRLWLERFSTRGYAARDPVFFAARRQALPFQWSDWRFRAGLDDDQIDILNEAADAGLLDGFTVPIHAPDALPASCSLAIGADGVDPLSVRDAHWYAVYAHESARRLVNEAAPPDRPRLGRRERQCLELIARGKTDFEIGLILGVSEHTVHNTVRKAMRKYGVATRMQAFVRALRDGELRMEDVAM
ncbi:MAG: LuxR family transcriptional regulator [Hyphomonadaceae bacterium]|nr:LuxR family transcriptional regulator [Hyphomonadaceae bacterium]